MRIKEESNFNQETGVLMKTILYYNDNEEEITEEEYNEALLASIPQRMERAKKEKEKRNILQWFKDTDYIELKAVRGTITRDSDKYQEYLTEYNIKLNRYKELETD